MELSDSCGRDRPPTDQVKTLECGIYVVEDFGDLGASPTLIEELGASTIASMCCYEDGAILPSSIGPGEKATGLVVLDVESPTGVLVYNDFSSMYGWEWAY